MSINQELGKGCKACGYIVRISFPKKNHMITECIKCGFKYEDEWSEIPDTIWASDPIIILRKRR